MAGAVRELAMAFSEPAPLAFGRVDNVERTPACLHRLSR